MGVRRYRPAERPVHEQMLRRGGQPLLAADDRIDLHQVIVDDDGELVGGEAVGFQEDLVLDRLERPLDVPVDEVVDSDGALLRHLESDDVVGLVPRALGRLGCRDVPAMAVVAGDLATGALRGPHLLQPLAAAEAVVRGAAVDELVGALLVERQALRLDVRGMRPALARALVVPDADPLQARVDVVDRARDEALLIGVLDAKDERARALASEEVVVQRRADAADVERAGRGWRESHPHAHHGESKERKLDA